jgi:hypothetical protein
MGQDIQVRTEKRGLRVLEQRAVWLAGPEARQSHLPHSSLWLWPCLSLSIRPCAVLYPRCPWAKCLGEPSIVWASSIFRMSRLLVTQLQGPAGLWDF